MPGHTLIVARNPLIRVQRRQPEKTPAQESTLDQAMTASRELKLDLGYDAESDLQRLLHGIQNCGPGWNNDVPGEAQSGHTVERQL